MQIIKYISFYVQRSQPWNNAWKAVPILILALSVIIHYYLLKEDNIHITTQLNETYDFVIGMHLNIINILDNDK